MKAHPKAISLVELMVGLVLIGLVVLGLSNIQVFSRSVFFRTDRRIKVQNDAAFVLQHMHKYIEQGIGDPSTPVINASQMPGYNLNQGVQVWIDSNPNGVLDKVCPPGDTLIAYALNTTTHQLFQHSDYFCNPAQKEFLAANIYGFNISFNPAVNNTLGVSISACGNFSGCGSSRDNPMVNMTTSIVLPSVALN